MADQKKPEPGTDDARAADNAESNAQREELMKKASRQIKKDVSDE